MALLSRTVNDLRKLLKVFEKYSVEHNAKKSKFLIFGEISTNRLPLFTLAGGVWKRVQQFKYLGHIVTANMKDELDVEREWRALAVRSNMLVRRFTRCSCEVKLTLFKTHCKTFYTCSLWTNYAQKTISAFRVQYNNTFEILLGLPLCCSASGMFADAHIDDLAAIRNT